MYLKNKWFLVISMLSHFVFSNPILETQLPFISEFKKVDKNHWSIELNIKNIPFRFKYDTLQLQVSSSNQIHTFYPKFDTAGIFVVTQSTITNTNISYPNVERRIG
jgi:hypothetical protein